MLTSLVLALLLSTPEADAAAELQLRAAGPVVLLVDGRPAPVMANLKMRAADLAPGPHDIRITGMFGKTLYEGQLELADGMITHAEWESRELRILKTEPLGERSGPSWPWQDDEPTEVEPPAEEPPLADDVAEAPLADDVEEPPLADDVEEEPPLADEVADSEPATADGEPDDEAVDADGERLVAVVGPPAASDPPLAIPAGGEAEPVERAAASLATDALSSAAGPASVDAPSRSLTLELREGMAVNVVHGDNTVRLTVRDGALVVEDDGGMTLTLE